MSHNQTNARAFWEFSLTVYAHPGVQEACLSLQDNCNVDVNVLLFMAWSGATRQVAIPRDEVARIDEESADWRDQVVRPLRQVRRRMKTRRATLPKGVDPYTALKAAELAAEQTQHYMLALTYPDLGRREAQSGLEMLATANMMTYMAVLGQEGSPNVAELVSIIAGAAAASGGAPKEQLHRE